MQNALLAFAFLRALTRGTLLVITLFLALLGAFLIAPTRLVSERWHARCLALPKRIVLRSVATSLGVRIVVAESVDFPPGASMTVANHQTYVDIPVLGCLLPGHFISKAEIRSWPVIGQVARLAGTQFVHRQHAKRRHAQIEAIAALLGRGVPLIGFPEATTSDGSRILPLRTGLFHAAALAGVPIVPVCLEFRWRDGRAMTQSERARHAWHGDEPFLSHLARSLMRPATLVVVRFGPVQWPPHGDRRQMAERVGRILEERFPKPVDAPSNSTELSGSS